MRQMEEGNWLEVVRKMVRIMGGVFKISMERDMREG